MASRTANFCIDAHDPRAQAEWWEQVLDDFVLDTSEDDPDEVGLRGLNGRWLLFLRVPEAKTAWSTTVVRATAAGPCWPTPRATSSACWPREPTRRASR